MAIRCLAREGNESHLERANVSATGCVGRKVPTPDLAPLRVQLDSIICPAAGRLGAWEPGTGWPCYWTVAPVLFLHGLVASAATNDPAALTAFQRPSVPDSRSQTPKKASGLLGCSKFYDWLAHPRLSSLDAREHPPSDPVPQQNPPICQEIGIPGVLQSVVCMSGARSRMAPGAPTPPPRSDNAP